MTAIRKKLVIVGDGCCGKLIIIDFGEIMVTYNEVLGPYKQQ